MRREIKRYIANPYDLNKIDIDMVKKNILKEIEIKEGMFDIKYPPNANVQIDSNGKQKYNYSFYTGSGGNIYLYWRQYLFYKKSPKYLNKFKIALETNLNVLNEIKKNSYTNSFFMGDSGIYLFCCIYGLETNNDKYFKEYFNKLINLKHLGDKKELELELLYGITGYLYSLLFLKKYLISIKQLKSFVNEEMQLDSLIIVLFYELIKKGIYFMQKNNWDECLLYPFPLNSNDKYFYLGAAHGLIGVIYMLLCTIKLYPNLLSDKNYEINKKPLNLSKFLIKNLNYIKSIQIKNGNFPDDVQGEDSGDKVHFCHGCVGAVHLFLLAEELFPKNDFDKIAKKCNNCLWERGLLYKGNGICHGMSGTCYAFMKLYIHSNDNIYLKEAGAVASATFDEKIQSLVSNYSDPQRKKRGIPDTPFSLMEGDGGLLIMYYDLIALIEKDKDIMTKVLPGYEIF